MIKATVGGERVEIWFTPSFNIKTTSKELELLLRGAELEVFDPWSKLIRTVKATKGEREAYLLLDEYRQLLPELKIKFSEAPEVPSSTVFGTKESPALD